MSQEWALQDALKYFQEDPEIKEVLTPSEFRSLSNPNTEFLKLLRTALEYQGFDPKVIMRQLIRSRKAYEAMRREKVEWDLSNVNDDFKITVNTRVADKFSNQESLSKDLEFLIMMFLLRNNHISKIIKKSVAGLSDILEMLKEKYDINDENRASGTSLGSKDITLPRITGVVPAVAVKMFHQGIVKEIVPFRSIPGTSLFNLAAGSEADVSQVQSEPRDMTHAICCPFLPSLHPKATADGSHIHALQLFVAIKLDDIIHKKEKDFTNLSDLITYYRAGYDSAATPETTRVEVMRKIGLMSNSSTRFTADALSISKACLEALKGMRTDDPNHRDMIEIADSGKVPDF